MGRPEINPQTVFSFLSLSLSPLNRTLLPCVKEAESVLFWWAGRHTPYGALCRYACARPQHLNLVNSLARSEWVHSFSSAPFQRDLITHLHRCSTEPLCKSYQKSPAFLPTPNAPSAELHAHPRPTSPGAACTKVLHSGASLSAPLFSIPIVGSGELNGRRVRAGFPPYSSTLLTARRESRLRFS